MVNILKRRKFWFVTLGVLVMGLLVWQSVRHYGAIRSKIAAVAGGPEPEEVYKAEIYFADFEYTKLVAESRELPAADSPEGRIRQVIEELIAGPTDETHSPTLPPDAVLKGVFVKAGVATLNFSEAVQSKSFGTTGELFAINSIYKTVVENEPSVFGVKLTVEGKGQTAFNGENGTVYCDFLIINELGPTVYFIPPPGMEDEGKG